jgi:hypothetical protein
MIRWTKASDSAVRGQSRRSLRRPLRSRSEPKIFDMRGRAGSPGDATSHLHGNDRRERRGWKPSLQEPQPASVSHPVDDRSPGVPCPYQQVGKESPAPSQGDETDLVGTRLEVPPRDGVKGRVGLGEFLQLAPLDPFEDFERGGDRHRSSEHPHAKGVMAISVDFVPWCDGPPRSLRSRVSLACRAEVYARVRRTAARPPAAKEDPV